MSSGSRQTQLDDPLARVLDAFTPEERDLTFQFFAMFSRFECALKRAGFIVKGPKDVKSRNDARADWDRYAARFAEFVGEDGRISTVGSQLMSQPPRRQVVAGVGSESASTLSWKDTPRNRGESDAAYVLRLVRVIRNNLFHGGKYPLARPDDTAHQQQRLQTSIDVLKYCLLAGPKDIAQKFRDLG